MPPAPFSALSSEYLRSLYEYSPGTAQYLGLHEYDGKLSDPSPEARAERVRRLQEFRARLEEYDAASLSDPELLDYELIRAHIEFELYELEQLRDFEWNPLAYMFPTDVSNYTNRSYAPLEDRVRSMIRHLQGVPEFLSAGLSNLRPDLPRHPLETAIDAFEGQISYLRDDLRAAVSEVRDESLLAELDAATGEAVRALQGFLDELRSRLPAATDDFAIGRERYEQMLRHGELVDLPLEQVLEVGERNLAENEALLHETARSINPDQDARATMRELGAHHPTAEGLIPDTADMLEEIRSFLIERKVVSVPSEVRCKVQETPPFLRWGFAFMDSPGPFETRADEAFYYVTPVEPEWTPEQQEEWLARFSYYTLNDVSIHEAYPGHYLHFLHMKSAPSDVSKVLTSYAFIEGWAHYCEQMMVEAGYGDGDPKLKLAQLSEALLRNCRYIVSIRMHTQGMTVDEATRFLMEHAYMDELPARKEAVRGTFDPGYLNYTLGKLQLLKLREDYRREHGEVPLQEFHDKVLSFGAPPVALVRKRLLKSAHSELL